MKKYYFGKMTITNETDVDVSFLFNIEDTTNLEKAVKNFEMTYFGNVSDEEDSYVVQGTGITYSGVAHTEITSVQYATMSKFLNVHKL